MNGYHFLAILFLLLAGMFGCLTIESAREPAREPARVPLKLSDCPLEVQEEAYMLGEDRCASCRDLESRNWIDAAQQRRKQVETCEAQLRACEEKLWSP